MTYNSLCHIFTSSYDWFCYLATFIIIVQKGGQVTSQSYVLVKLLHKTEMMSVSQSVYLSIAPLTRLSLHGLYVGLGLCTAVVSVM